MHVESEESSHGYRRLFCVVPNVLSSLSAPSWFDNPVYNHVIQFSIINNKCQGDELTKREDSFWLIILEIQVYGEWSSLPWACGGILQWKCIVGPNHWPFLDKTQNRERPQSLNFFSGQASSALKSFHKTPLPKDLTVSHYHNLEMRISTF